MFPVDLLKAAWREGCNGTYVVPTSSSPPTRAPVLKSNAGIRCWCGCEGPAWCAYATALIEYNNRFFEEEEETARAQAEENTRAQALANEEGEASRKRARSPDPTAEEVDVPSFNYFHLEDVDNFQWDDEMPTEWEGSTDTPRPVIDWEARLVGTEMKRPRLQSHALESAAEVDVFDYMDTPQYANPDVFLSTLDDPDDMDTLPYGDLNVFFSIPDDGVGA
jgi:hypothetical protein